MLGFGFILVHVLLKNLISLVKQYRTDIDRFSVLDT